MYVPEKSIAIDEKLVLFKGGMAFKQYTPSKHARFGIRMIPLCNTSEYYYETSVYVKKAREPLPMTEELGAAGAIVVHLLRDLTNRDMSRIPIIGICPCHYQITFSLLALACVVHCERIVEESLMTSRMLMSPRVHLPSAERGRPSLSNYMTRKSCTFYQLSTTPFVFGQGTDRANVFSVSKSIMTTIVACWESTRVMSWSAANLPAERTSSGIRNLGFNSWRRRSRMRMLSTSCTVKVTRWIMLNLSRACAKLRSYKAMLPSQ